MAVVSEDLITTITVSNTTFNSISGVTEYQYTYSVMSDFLTNTLITVFLILGLICIVFGIVMFWINPALEDKSKENSDRNMWDNYDD